MKESVEFRYVTRALSFPIAIIALVFVLFARTEAADEDAVTKAIDSIATQWSFQLAYQKMPDYHDDTLDNGMIRPAGADNYWQLRVVAPFVFDSFTLLPRLTLRHYESPNGDDG